jgi:hypothetical protein
MTKVSSELQVNITEDTSHIHNLCLKLSEIGADYVPFVFPVLVYYCFDTTRIPVFKLHMLTL